MGLSYKHLDSRTRTLMLDEIDTDEKVGKLYVSSRLNDQGINSWPDLLKNVAKQGDDDELGRCLRNGRLKSTEQRRKPKGGFTTVAVPVTAADTLAEGEFNRFYIRALCRRAIEDSVPNLVIYRAKNVTNPRWESIQMEGQTIDARRLLDDLRANPGVDTALGLPPGPNSGMSVKF